MYNFKYQKTVYAFKTTIIRQYILGMGDQRFSRDLNVYHPFNFFHL